MFLPPSTSIQRPASLIDKQVTEVNKANYNQLGLGFKEPEVEKKDIVSLDNFMQLFLTQLQHQDPLEPEKGADFVGQLAQFSSVEGLAKLEGTAQSGIELMKKNQALQVTNMLGRAVPAKTAQMQLKDGNQIEGNIIIPEPLDSLKVTFFDNLGNSVKAYEVNPQGLQPGNFSFDWDGTDADGHRLPDGNYRINVQAIVNGKAERLDTQIFTKVESIGIDKESGEYKLNLVNASPVKLSEVSQIQ